MSISFLYTTLDDHKQSKEIAKYLVQEKLAACVNIIPKIESYFFYQDKLQKSHEYILLIKTRKNLIKWVRASLEKRHPYQCPCLVELSIESANEVFSHWVFKETNLK